MDNNIIDCVSVTLIYCGKGKVIVLVTAFYPLEIVIFSGLPSTVIGFCCGRITFVISCIHCSKMLCYVYIVPRCYVMCLSLYKCAYK